MVVKAPAMNMGMQTLHSGLLDRICHVSLVLSLMLLVV